MPEENLKHYIQLIDNSTQDDLKLLQAIVNAEHYSFSYYSDTQRNLDALASSKNIKTGELSNKEIFDLKEVAKERIAFLENESYENYKIIHSQIEEPISKDQLKPIRYTLKKLDEKVNTSTLLSPRDKALLIEELNTKRKSVDEYEERHKKAIEEAEKIKSGINQSIVELDLQAFDDVFSIKSVNNTSNNLIKKLSSKPYIEKQYWANYKLSKGDNEKIINDIKNSLNTMENKIETRKKKRMDTVKSMDEPEVKNAHKLEIEKAQKKINEHKDANFLKNSEALQAVQEIKENTKKILLNIETYENLSQSGKESLVDDRTKFLKEVDKVINRPQQQINEATKKIQEIVKELDKTDLISKNQIAAVIAIQNSLPPNLQDHLYREVKEATDKILVEKTKQEGIVKGAVNKINELTKNLSTQPEALSNSQETLNSIEALRNSQKTLNSIKDEVPLHLQDHLREAQNPAQIKINDLIVDWAVKEINKLRERLSTQTEALSTAQKTLDSIKNKVPPLSQDHLDEAQNAAQEKINELNKKNKEKISTIKNEIKTKIEEWYSKDPKKTMIADKIVEHYNSKEKDPDKQTKKDKKNNMMNAIDNNNIIALFASAQAHRYNKKGSTPDNLPKSWSFCGASIMKWKILNDESIAPKDKDELIKSVEKIEAERKTNKNNVLANLKLEALYDALNDRLNSESRSENESKKILEAYQERFLQYHLIYKVDVKSSINLMKNKIGEMKLSPENLKTANAILKEAGSFSTGKEKTYTLLYELNKELNRLNNLEKPNQMIDIDKIKEAASGTSLFTNIKDKLKKIKEGRIQKVDEKEKNETLENHQEDFYETNDGSDYYKKL